MATAADIQYHYDVDTDFFRIFLDSQYQVYSCGVWQSATTLEEAQLAKLTRLASFARIGEGSRVLDIGCGWGGMLRFALDECDASEAVGLTLSRDQYAFVSGMRRDRLTVKLLSWDGFSPTTAFDAVVSIGAFEHFASREDRAVHRQIEVYRRFFQTCASVCVPDSYLGLQTIVTARKPANRREILDAGFLLKNVFPGSALPTITDIQQASAGIYEIRELRTIGPDYARTLQEWKDRLLSRPDLTAPYGSQLIEHYREYFDCARRNFETGVTELAQFSFCRLTN
jgi:cyclopropane-fatty-acyl-phospholipid synthase